MGNLEQKMGKAKPIEELASTLKHIEQTRSDSEIQITNKLTQLLSDVNTERILKNKQNLQKKLNWSEYIFVCVQGLPALQKQFSMLELPGETIYFSALNFSQDARNSTHDSRLKFVYQSTFKKQAQRLNQLFNSIKKKNIILVYHSVGNGFLSMYFHYYGYAISQKIKGMIDISGIPLRYYMSAQLLVPIIMETDFSQIVQHADKVHKLFMKSMSSSGFGLGGFKTKYQTLSFLHYTKSPDYGQLFDSTWNHPKVLKLFIHGRNDTLFESKLLNQKVIYYSYRKQLPEDYENKLKQKYKKIYNVQKAPNNLQQRFIFAIPKGQHSVHLQQRNHQLIKTAVHQYLALIHQ